MKITQEYLQECFSYNHETGVLTWKERPREHFNTDRGCRIFNSGWAGKEAGSIKIYSATIEYRAMSIYGKYTFAHRLIWTLVYGEEPVEIDHINGNGLDNRIENLRNVDHKENLLNQKIYSCNTSGVAGVRWDSERQKWSVQIGVQNKALKLGRYLDKFEASCVRKSAELKYGYHKNSGRK